MMVAVVELAYSNTRREVVRVPAPANATGDELLNAIDRELHRTHWALNPCGWTLQHLLFEEPHHVRP